MDCNILFIVSRIHSPAEERRQAELLGGCVVVQVKKQALNSRCISFSQKALWGAGAGAAGVPGRAGP